MHSKTTLKDQKLAVSLICFIFVIAGLFAYIVSSTSIDSHTEAYAAQAKEMIYQPVKDRPLTANEEAIIAREERERAEAEEAERLVREEEERLAEEAAAQEVYYYEEPVYYSGGNSYGNDFYSQGEVKYNNETYTWYSQNVLPGGGLTDLNNNGRHVGENGFIYDADGYIAVGSDSYKHLEIVDTPWGPGKVYDSGSTGIDIYTDF